MTMERWCTKIDQKFFSIQGGPVGTAKIAMDRELICVPGNATLTVPESTSKVNSSWSCRVDQAAHPNLPNGLVVNSYCIIPKNQRVPLILVNTTDHNTRVRQPLLAPEPFEAEVQSKPYYTEMDREGDEIVISFQPVPPNKRNKQVKSNMMEVEENKINNKRILLQWITPGLGRV